jgi:hypothetical protein
VALAAGRTCSPDEAPRLLRLGAQGWDLVDEAATD